jgi:hypothetical protein
MYILSMLLGELVVTTRGATCKHYSAGKSTPTRWCDAAKHRPASASLIDNLAGNDAHDVQCVECCAVASTVHHHLCLRVEVLLQQLPSVNLLLLLLLLVLVVVVVVVLLLLLLLLLQQHCVAVFCCHTAQCNAVYDVEFGHNLRLSCTVQAHNLGVLHILYNAQLLPLPLVTVLLLLL